MLRSSFYIIQTKVSNSINKETNPLKLNTVILDEFYAEAVYEDKFVLHWTTSYEMNNYGFEIYEKTNGDYYKIGFVAGSGTTDTTHEYSYTAYVETGKTYLKL